MNFDWNQLPSPCYVIDVEALERNLQILADVRRRAGCQILLALKAFATSATFPLMRDFLDGVAASSLNEARLGAEAFGSKVHVYGVALRPDEFDDLHRLAHTMVFNSLGQWQRFQDRVDPARVRLGLRINPEYSEVDNALYNPCAPGSRLGVTRAALTSWDPQLTGLMFHTLCEQGSGPLERTLTQVTAKFGHLFSELEWINFGGGHHITRADYDVEHLIALIGEFRRHHSLEIIVEPGEAVVLGSGYLVCTVLDIVENGARSAILDTSATAHMPDVLEMPYRPEVLGTVAGEGSFSYRLCGLSCLAGDVVGDYSFAQPLKVGQRIVFTEMAHYTIVKNTTFNGVALPSIAVVAPSNGKILSLKKFGYEAYRDRIG